MTSSRATWPVSGGGARRCAELVEQQKARRCGRAMCNGSQHPAAAVEGDAFRECAQGRSTRSKVLNEARSDENQVTNKASADRRRADQHRRIRPRPAGQRMSSARPSSFRRFCPHYQANPNLFRAAAAHGNDSAASSPTQEKMLARQRRGWKIDRELALLLNREPDESRQTDEASSSQC